ncbi:GDP-L-fucose synthase family protein [Draconibacterium sp.]|uniref:GDP-L-fucose synthase family protein n=1 Tax=Draconibacterium sp. TaxID=1965318 RepID=UPI0035621A03
MNKDAKIYIAGHKGLVGSAIWKNFQNKGYTNLIGRSLEELDLMNQQAVADFFEQEKPEYVVLAAAKVGGIIANNTYRGQFIYENLQIQNNVIHQSYVHGVKKLLFLGSTCIYPKQAPQPMPENCLLTDTLEYTNEPYAIAKIAGLKMCESYNLQYGTNFISVMPTNLYGPNDNFNLETSHVLPAMVRKIHLSKCLENNNWEAIREDLDRRPVEGVTGKADEKDILKILTKYGINTEQANSEISPSQSLTVPQSNSLSAQRLTVSLDLWGTGKPMREFLWSEDMADACVFLMENRNFEDVKSECEGEIVNTHINIGTGKEISIRQLSEVIQKEIGFQGTISFDTTKPDGTMRKLTDPSKLHRLGWKHNIELKEGIKMMYEHYLKG